MFKCRSCGASLSEVTLIFSPAVTVPLRPATTPERMRVALKDVSWEGASGWDNLVEASAFCQCGCDQQLEIVDFDTTHCELSPRPDPPGATELQESMAQLALLYQRAARLRERLGFSAPGACLWHGARDMVGVVLADGLGGARHVIGDGVWPDDFMELVTHKFATEAAAIAAAQAWYSCKAGNDE